MSAAPAHLVTVDHLVLYRPYYSVWVQCSDTTDVIDHYEAVPDDFGTLLRVDNGARRVSQGGDSYHDFCDLEQAFEQHLRATYPMYARERSPVRKITAEIKPSEIYGVAQEINIEDDRRPGTALYRIAVGHEDPIYVTHAQLAALLFAAAEIVKPARARKVVS